MKVIFLDIDGVLNTEHYITAFWDMCKRMELKRPEANSLMKEIMRDEYGNHFCPVACRNLDWIIKETDAKIVISSTWRMSGLNVMRDMWRDRGLSGEIIDVTPIHSLKKCGRNKELPFAERMERGNEIQAWLDAHPEVESYVIFDDDNDMLPSQMNNFIQTDEFYGITLKDAEMAIKILKNETGR